MTEVTPSIAVVVTVKNDHRVIDCVEGILSQDVDLDYEVVVVDNGSTDDTPDRLESAFGDHEQVRLLSIDGNLSAAWNGAARRSNGEILVRIDADAVPEPGWLEAILDPILDGEAGWTAGPVEGFREGTLVERYFAHRTKTYCQRLAKDRTLRAGVPSWNVAYTREALDKAGWYDPWQASSVDWDLHARIVDAGVEGRYAPGAWIKHHHPRTLRAFARKEAWYRTGQYQMMLKYGPGLIASTFVLPGAYTLVAGALLGGLVFPPSAIAGGSLLGLLLLIHAVGGLREGDPMWWARMIFRPVEAGSGLYGLLRGFVRYGVSPRAPPEPVESPGPS